MSIQRAPRPQGNFYILDKSISEDRRLSWAARGLLVYLLGKPDHWQVSTTALVNETAGTRLQSGRDAVRALLGELIDAGYVTRTPSRDGSGKIAGYDYTVSEVCAAPSPDNPGPVEPSPDKPGPAQPSPANPPQVSTDSLASTETAASTESSADFEEAWKLYPKRPNNSKAAALKAWNARIKAGVTPARMIEGVKRYAAFCAANKTEPQYIKQAATFFGPDLHFDSDYTVSPPTAPRGRPSMNSFDQSQPDDYDDFFNHRRGFD